MTIADESWFARSMFVPDEARAQVSAQLRDYYGMLREYFARHRITDVNLQVSGSLARQEPSVVRAPDGTARLASDVDLVAVTAGDTGDAHPVHGLVAAMEKAAPEILTTMFFVRATHLHRVRSLFGRDLWIGYHRPIVRNFDTKPFTEPATGAREALESLVHQLAGYLLLPATADTTGHPRLTREFQRTKLALEALRAMVKAEPGQPILFTDLLVPARAPDLDQVVPHDELARLLEARELSLPCDLGAERTEELVVVALCRLFGVGPHTSDLLEALTAYAVTTTHVLPQFQVALAALFLLRLPSEVDSKPQAAKLVLWIWHQLDKSQLIEARDVLEGMLVVDSRRLGAADEDALATVYDGMRALRLDYYHYLGPHNFGRRPIPEYVGPGNGHAPATQRRSHGVSGMA